MKFIISCLAFFFFISLKSQNTYSVDNKPGAAADFSNLQDAIDAVPAGSTLLVQGSYDGYPLILNKQLTIIGSGYYLVQNTETQAYSLSTMVSSMTFNAGSEGSVVKGLESSGGVKINTSNINIENCRIEYISFQENSNNIAILNNFIFGTISCGNSCSYAIGDCTNCSNILIKGNIINYTIKMRCPVEITSNIFRMGGGSFSSQNNYSWIEGSILKSNIINQPSGGFSQNNTFTNNVFLRPFTGTASIDENFNKRLYCQSGHCDDVYIDPSDPRYTDDGRYLLSSTSPALGAGTGGIDCGAFGGGYRLSGIPNIPNIYEFTVPDTGYTNDGGIPITIKVRANN